MLNPSFKLALAVSGCLFSLGSFAALTPNEVGLVINDADQYSVSIGEYYRVKRGIPDANIVHVSFPVHPSISSSDMDVVHKKVWNSLPPTVQSIAVAWGAPYVISTIGSNGYFSYCGSVTSVLSSAPSNLPPSGVPGVCADLKSYLPKSYKVSSTGKPGDYGIRPSMLLAGRTFNAGKAIIDNALKAEESNSDPVAYASAKWITEAPGGNELSSAIASTARPYNLSLYYGSPRPMGDAMFFFAKNDIRSVPSSIEMLPGSIFINGIDGGDLFEKMDTSNGDKSVLNFTGSGRSSAYGSIPHGEKDPAPNFDSLIKSYLSGDTIVEAFYKNKELSGWEVFVGDPLTRPYSNKPVTVNANYAIEANKAAYFSALSDNQNISYRWEMPDGAILFGADVTWTPPTSMGTKNGKEYSYVLAIIDGDRTQTREKRVLITESAPEFKINIKKPSVFRFGNAHPLSNQSINVEVVDSISEFPVFRDLVIADNKGNNIALNKKQPYPLQRIARTSLFFNTDSIPSSLIENERISLTFSVSRILDTSEIITRDLTTPAVTGFRISPFRATMGGDFNFVAGYQGIPIKISLNPIDWRWNFYPNEEVSIKWTLPAGALIEFSGDDKLTHINGYDSGRGFATITPLQIGRIGPIIAELTDSTGDSTTTKIFLQSYDPAKVEHFARLKKDTKFDVAPQWLRVEVIGKNMGFRDSFSVYEVAVDGVKQSNNYFLIKDTLPHEISYKAGSSFGIKVSGVINHQLSENQLPSCTFSNSVTKVSSRSGEQVLYKVIPKCVDVDGKVKSILYTVDGSKLREIFSTAVYATKAINEPAPVFTFNVYDDKGKFSVISTSDFPPIQ